MKRQTAPAACESSEARSIEGNWGWNTSPAVSAETTGSQQLCMHMAAIAPLARAKPHLGEAGMRYGEICAIPLYSGELAALAVQR
jgi:uncharacterized RmlC-like cupin family protein